MNDVVKHIYNQISSLSSSLIIIGIDGRCASGKTTLASNLAKEFDCNVIHMDDFFLPPYMQTPERYKEVGGNIHYERFKTEVITPLINGEDFSYGVFSCSDGKITHYESILGKRINIIEGAYSLHPYFGDIYDIKIFCDCELLERVSRIKKRNGQKALTTFLEKWIPFEEAYLKTFKIEEKCDYIINMKGK